jgi:hypothetical protein
MNIVLELRGTDWVPIRSTPWHEIDPKDALGIQLPQDGIVGPLTMEGNPCPWPWDPIQLVGAPIGQYHCPYCGEMVIAGMNHVDYREVEGEGQ